KKTHFVLSDYYISFCRIYIAEGDKATQDFLWQFVREQVEEEATASGIVDRLKRMGDSAIFNLDEQYGRRA
ncbi:ferritin-like domain-containing protein, partial [uncultured Prevotella sp.]|uniref:ferritin-like domain-containing protein n=1 Tax=uncultured Prevotella sp. TaxID=159272 RepID=UPI00280415E0